MKVLIGKYTRQEQKEQTSQPTNKQDKRGHKPRQSKQTKHPQQTLVPLFCKTVNNLASPTRRARDALGRHHSTTVQKTTELVEKVQTA